MSTELNIVEAFGKFIVETDKGPKILDTMAEAEKVAAEFANGAAYRGEAKAYTDYAELDGKNAQGKANVITAYLAWIDAGKPAAPVKVEDEGEADTESTEDAAAETADEDTVEF